MTSNALRSLMVVAVAVLAFWAIAAGAQNATPPIYTLHADGLACPFCAYGIEKQLSKIDGVEQIDVDIESGTITLTMAEGASLDEATARKAVEAAGFTLRDFARGGG